MVVLQVAATRESTPRDNEENVVKGSSIASPECLKSSSDTGSGGLEEYLRKRFDGFSGEELERIVEVDLCAVQEFLDESGVEHGNRAGMVCNDKERPLGM